MSLRLCSRAPDIEIRSEAGTGTILRRRTDVPVRLRFRHPAGRILTRTHFVSLCGKKCVRTPRSRDLARRGSTALSPAPAAGPWILAGARSAVWRRRRRPASRSTAASTPSATLGSRHTVAVSRRCSPAAAMPCSAISPHHGSGVSGGRPRSESTSPSPTRGHSRGSLCLHHAPALGAAGPGSPGWHSGHGPATDPARPRPGGAPPSSAVNRTRRAARAIRPTRGRSDAQALRRRTGTQSTAPLQSPRIAIRASRAPSSSADFSGSSARRAFRDRR